MKDESSAARAHPAGTGRAIRTPGVLAALTEASGLPKPSVLRILSRLADAGMLREPASKSYVSGPGWRWRATP